MALVRDETEKGNTSSGRTSNSLAFLPAMEILKDLSPDPLETWA
jgi:hypothetical protein